MIKQIKSIGFALIHFMPIQLLGLQMRKYKLLLAIWAILLGMVSGGIGQGMGLMYLFLEPEYLGQEGFWSFLWVGGALGTFLFSYMIALYINESVRFHFIGLTRRPFLTFSLNNSLLPVLLLLLFVRHVILFHLQTDGLSLAFAGRMAGMILGIVMAFGLYALYFFATRRKGIFHQLADVLERELERAQGGRNRRLILQRARESFQTQAPVRTYIALPFHLHAAEMPKEIEFRTVVSALNKNHGQLLLLLSGILLLLTILGLLGAYPWAQIPAGASLLMVFAFVFMGAGMLSFWFRKAGALPVIIIAVILYGYDRLEFLQEKHHILGLNYLESPVRYDAERQAELVHPDTVAADRAATLQMLERWRRQYPAGSKPRAVFVCLSGGGLRSALWSTAILQQLDSLSGGAFTRDIRLYTGASGGMIGASYFRELCLRKQLGELHNLHDHEYRRRISADLLNRIGFQLFTDILLPNYELQLGQYHYVRERGAAFDQQLGVNLPELRQRRLGDYSRWEREGVIPPLFLAPSITNDGRRLYISASPISFMVKPLQVSENFRTRPGGIEFRRFFQPHNPDSLFMSSAIRMNATFPLVLPVVDLPSVPAMEVMDAGAVDNYGIQVAMRYLFEFRHWFATHTSGVLLVSIRDNLREDPLPKHRRSSMFSKLLTPFGGGYRAYAQSKELATEQLIETAHDWFPGAFSVLTFEYSNELAERPASISFHLTAREKKSILDGLHSKHNQTGFDLIQKMYPPK